MSFRVLGLSPDPFRPLFALSNAELDEIGARRIIADNARMPCRVSMEHAAPGEELLLLSYEHQPANTTYRATHAIYVRRVATKAFDGLDIVPEVLGSRLLAVRAFDARHMMIDAEVCAGEKAASVFGCLLDDPETSYLHVHNAARGCFAARVERV
jgi:hypothetical protein